MRFLVTFAVLSVSAAVLMADQDLDRDEQNWATFKAKHGKDYMPGADAVRMSIFLSNDAKIRAHNSKSGVTWLMGHNQFSDMTDIERSKVLGVQAPAAANRFSRPQIDNADEESDIVMEDRQSPIDYRTHKCMNAVKNQGGCGSCWAFAAITPIEFSHCMKRKNTTAVNLSEQQLVDCMYTRDGCQGGWMDTAFNYFKSIKSQSTPTYPYTGVYASCKYDASKGVATVATYGSVSPMTSAGIATALAKYGPLSVAIRVEDPFYSYKSGVFNTKCTKKGINHGVVIVGHATSPSPAHWIVRNSWGSWGDKGYIRMARGSNLCEIESYASWVVAN